MDDLVARVKEVTKPWPAEDVEDFLAILLLSYGPGADPDPELAAFVGRFAVRAGIRSVADEDDVRAAVAERAAELDVKMVDAVARAVAEVSAQSGSKQAAAFASFLGEAAVPAGGARPPSSTKPAGGIVLSKLMMREKEKK